MKLIKLLCCNCGKDCYAKAQWWNRARGFGICHNCIGDEKTRLAPHQLAASYGAEGFHYFIRQPRATGEAQATEKDRIENVMRSLRARPQAAGAGGA